MTHTLSQADQEVLRVQAFVSADLWRRARARAALQSLSSTQVLTEALEAWLASEEKGKVNA